MLKFIKLNFLPDHLIYYFLCLKYIFIFLTQQK